MSHCVGPNAKSTAPPRRYTGQFNLYATQTPGQTLGPFFHDGLLGQNSAGFGNDLCPPLPAERSAQRIRVTGRVLDGLNRPVTDALLEIWQANAEGIYAHPLDPRYVKPGAEGFLGFGRAATNDQGVFEFRTILPGSVPVGRNRMQAPHLNLIVGARGLMRHVFTRIYFAGDKALGDDTIFQSVPESRRGTLLAKPVNVPTAAATSQSQSSPPVAMAYQFDVRFQGSLETVFFDV